MNTNSLSETELTEILKMAQEGETQLKEMSDFATLMAEKWKAKTHKSEKNIVGNNTGVYSPSDRLEI
jgi:hypothetical protein